MIASPEGMITVSTKNVPFENEPEVYFAVATLVIALKSSLKRISTHFVQNRTIANPSKGGRLILSDQMRLMRLEHGLTFSKVTELRFGQQIYDALMQNYGVEKNNDKHKREGSITG